MLDNVLRTVQKLTRFYLPFHSHIHAVKMSLVLTVSSMFYQLALRLIHSVFTLVEWCKEWTERRRHASLKQFLTNYDTINQMPTNVGLVVSFDEVTYSKALLNQLANLVKWSVLLGIKNVTVYDDKGELRSWALNLATYKLRDQVTNDTLCLLDWIRCSTR